MAWLHLAAAGDSWGMGDQLTRLHGLKVLVSLPPCICQQQPRESTNPTHYRSNDRGKGVVAWSPPALSRGGFLVAPGPTSSKPFTRAVPQTRSRWIAPGYQTAMVPGAG